MTKETTLNPGDDGYDEAVSQAPYQREDGSVNRLKSPQDAQRERDEANNLAVLKAQRAAAKSTAKGTEPAPAKGEK